MRLLIISHTPHYMRDGQVVGWSATIREVDELARLFDSVVHIAPLYPGTAPGSAMAYESARVRLRPVTPVGGGDLRHKLSIPLCYPGYARVILQERRAADVIHIRAPANISLLALILLALLGDSKLRWAKYAGDWNCRQGEPWSYRFQRWLLSKGWHRLVVTVNGHVPNQPGHVRSFLNPCLSAAELEEGIVVSQRKQLGQPVQLLFVGRLESAKGAGVCLKILARLGNVGIDARLTLIGDGQERQKFEQQARDLNLVSRVNFHGGLPRNELGRFYGLAHFILLPSESEGWPKVLSEAMAYGVVPIASAVGSIPEFLKSFSTGSAICSLETGMFCAAVESYLRNPAGWSEHSRNAVQAAQRFSYGNYLQAVRKLLDLPVSAETATA